MLAPRLKQLALVIFVAAVVMLTNLGGPRLWDRDEPRNAGCAREMLSRGDWIVPTFNGKLRTAQAGAALLVHHVGVQRLRA